MLIETLKIPNGEVLYAYHIFKCDKCEKTIESSFPHTEENENHFCWECSLITGKISEKEYLKCSGNTLPNSHASIIEGKVLVWVGNKAPWKKTNKEQRNTPRYQRWRTSVFERDNYTCQHCEQVGGELNAHHIKEFAKFKKLRYELSNGLTLCINCHREVHKKKR